jgi:hypothetical protein
MAADALDAYTADAQLGRDALLLCDTTEMADALNQRIHRDRMDQNAATVTAARGQQVGVGDLIISRRNDPTIDFHHSTPGAESLPSVRNGNRWRVAAIDAETNRVAAERLDDHARVVFHNDYLRDHVSLGYAVTVHSAQGVTADASHAVLGENTSRAMLYVAMTRGRQTNTARIYQRTTEAHEYGRQGTDGTHVTDRGDRREAADLLREILANDHQAVTAHDYASRTPDEALPDRVRSLLNRRATATRRRNALHQTRETDRQQDQRSRVQTREQHANRNRDRSSEYGLEL